MDKNFRKALAEKRLAELWFDGEINQEEAEVSAKEQSLEMAMINWWYGCRYHKVEVAGQ